MGWQVIKFNLYIHMIYTEKNDDPHFHLWTDALHAKALAHQSKNDWNRGTYVRWCIITTSIVFEMMCSQALKIRITRDLKGTVNNELKRKGLELISWEKGIWKEMSDCIDLRNEYIHRNTSQKILFPELVKSDIVINAVKDAAEHLFMLVGKSFPQWFQVVDDKGWEEGQNAMCHASAIIAGADQASPTTLRIAYVWNNLEKNAYYLPQDSNYMTYLESLMNNVNVAVSGFKVYQGDNLIYHKDVNMRGTKKMQYQIFSTDSEKN